MKRVFLLAAAALMAFMLSSCSSVPDKINDFVGDVEKKCESFEEKDWEMTQQEYRKLVAEYEENYDSYTDEEKEKVGKAIGRYNGLLLRSGVKSLMNQVEDLGRRTAPVIEGFFEGLTDKDE